MTRIVTILHHPAPLGVRSGLYPVARELGARVIRHEIVWEKVQRKSWSAGQALRRMGNAYYGSGWNALVPVWDDVRIAAVVARAKPEIVHFLWGEFASPKWPSILRRKGARIFGTFHCSARRQSSVLSARRDFREFDRIIVVSATQTPFFVERGFPEEHVRTIPLGVDTDFFHPAPGERNDIGPLQGLLVGQTERDHEFMVSVMKALPPGTLNLRVCTARDYHALYRGVPGVEIMSQLGDEDFVRLYQESDLLIMPLLDCTANHAVLEAMACGKPVMVNRVGGIAEYVDESAGFLMEGKNVSEWVARLTALATNRAELARRGTAAREWVQRFSWPCIAERYRAFYSEVLSPNSPIPQSPNRPIS